MWGEKENRELQEELEELGMGEYDQRKGHTYFDHRNNRMNT